MNNGSPSNSSIARKFRVAAIRRGPTFTLFAVRSNLASSIISDRFASVRRILSAIVVLLSVAWSTTPTHPFPSKGIPSIRVDPRNCIAVMPAACSSFILFFASTQSVFGYVRNREARVPIMFSNRNSWFSSIPDRSS